MGEKKLAILHIEDDHVDRMVVERVIKKLNITDHLFHAANGEEALDLLRGGNGGITPETLPQVIILDINMPRMNGLEFLRELRQDEKLKHLSVFIMTTSNDDDDRAEAYELNIAGYILKPVDINQFESTFKILSDFWKLCEWP
jgi:CheY-like chemotaxis protein